MREFAVSQGSAQIAGSATLVFLNPAAAPSVNIEVLRWWIGFSGTATSAQQRVQIETQVTSFPTLVAATPAKLKRADPNASVLVGSTNGFPGTAGTNASNENGGAQTMVWEECFNVLNGWLCVYTPPETLVMPASSTSGVGMRVPVVPTAVAPWSFGCVFREV